MREVMENRQCRYCARPITMPCQAPRCVTMRGELDRDRHETQDNEELAAWRLEDRELRERLEAAEAVALEAWLAENRHRRWLERRLTKLQEAK